MWIDILFYESSFLNFISLSPVFLSFLCFSFLTLCNLDNHEWSRQKFAKEVVIGSADIHVNSQWESVFLLLKNRVFQALATSYPIIPSSVYTFIGDAPFPRIGKLELSKNLVIILRCLRTIEKILPCLRVVLTDKDFEVFVFLYFFRPWSFPAFCFIVWSTFWSVF